MSFLDPILGMGPTGEDRTWPRECYIRVYLSSLINPLTAFDDLAPIFFADLPEPFTINKSAVYNPETIMGRSEPLRYYSASTATTISFTGKLIAMGEPKDPGAMAMVGQALNLTGRVAGSAVAPYLGIAGNVASLIYDELAATEEKIATIVNAVHTTANRIKALVYPQYDINGIAYPPPKVVLHYGPNYEGLGVITSVSIAYQGPYEINSMLAMRADCSITFEEVNPRAPGYGDAKKWNPIAITQARANIGTTLLKDATSLARSKFGI
jgi:hypothetical protein